MAKTKAKSSKSTLKVDFTGVEAGKGSRRYKPGDYGVKVIKAEVSKKDDDKKPYVIFTMKFLDGKYKGKEIRHYCYLTAAALWKLRNTLEAMGMKVPSKPVNVDLKKTINKKLGISVEDDEYEGKIRSKIVDEFLFSELESRQEKDDDEDLDEDEEDDDEDSDEEDDDEDEDDEDEDVDEVDTDDL